MASSGSGTKDVRKSPSKEQRDKWREGVPYLVQLYFERWGSNDPLAVTDKSGLEKLIERNWRKCGAGEGCRCEEICEHLLWPSSCPISYAHSVAECAIDPDEKTRYQKIFLDAVDALQNGEAIGQGSNNYVQDGACPLQKVHSELLVKMPRYRKRKGDSLAESNPKRERTRGSAEGLPECSPGGSSEQNPGASSVRSTGILSMPSSRAELPSGLPSNPCPEATVRHSVKMAVLSALWDPSKDARYVIMNQFCELGDPRANCKLREALRSWDLDGVLTPNDQSSPERQIMYLLWDCKDKDEKRGCTSWDLVANKVVNPTEAKAKSHDIALGVLDAFEPLSPKELLPDDAMGQLVPHGRSGEPDSWGGSFGGGGNLSEQSSGSFFFDVLGSVSFQPPGSTEGYSAALSSSVPGAVLDSADVGSVSGKSVVLDGEQQGASKSGEDIRAVPGEFPRGNFSEKHLQAPLSRQASEEVGRYDGARTERTDKDADRGHGSSEQAVCEKQLTFCAAGTKPSPSTCNSCTGVSGSGVADSSLARCSDGVELGIPALAEEKGAPQTAMSISSAASRTTTSDVLHDGKDGAAGFRTGNGAQSDGSPGSRASPPSSQGNHCGRLGPQANASVETRTVSANHTEPQKGNTFERPETITGGPLVRQSRDAERVCTSKAVQRKASGQSPIRSGQAEARFDRTGLAEVLTKLELSKETTPRLTPEEPETERQLRRHDCKVRALSPSRLAEAEAERAYALAVHQKRELTHTVEQEDPDQERAAEEVAEKGRQERGAVQQQAAEHEEAQNPAHADLSNAELSKNSPAARDQIIKALLRGPIAVVEPATGNLKSAEEIFPGGVSNNASLYCVAVGLYNGLNAYLCSDASTNQEFKKLFWSELFPGVQRAQDMNRKGLWEAIDCFFTLVAASPARCTAVKAYLDGYFDTPRTACDARVNTATHAQLEACFAHMLGAVKGRELAQRAEQEELTKERAAQEVAKKELQERVAELQQAAKYYKDPREQTGQRHRELEAATDGFSSATLVEEGALGQDYLGTCSHRQVAIKKLRNEVDCVPETKPGAARAEAATRDRPQLEDASEDVGCVPADSCSEQPGRRGEKQRERVQWKEPAAEMAPPEQRQQVQPKTEALELDDKRKQPEVGTLKLEPQFVDLQVLLHWDEGWRMQEPAKRRLKLVDLPYPSDRLHRLETVAFWRLLQRAGGGEVSEKKEVEIREDIAKHVRGLEKYCLGNWHCSELCNLKQYLSWPIEVPLNDPVSFKKMGQQGIALRVRFIRSVLEQEGVMGNAGPSTYSLQELIQDGRQAGRRRDPSEPCTRFSGLPKEEMPSLKLKMPSLHSTMNKA